MSIPLWMIAAAPPLDATVGRRIIAFAADRLIESLAAANKVAVIPSKSNRSAPRPYDKELYKARHLIENFFCKLKQFRAIATRYDKLARNFLAAIHLAASLIWLN